MDARDCPLSGPSQHPAPHARTMGSRFRTTAEEGTRWDRQPVQAEAAAARAGGTAPARCPRPFRASSHHHPRAPLQRSPLHETSEKSSKGCYLESLQRQLTVGENDVKPQTAQAPATATVPDPTELLARVVNVTSASSALGFGRHPTVQRGPWEVWVLRHFL